MTEPRWVTLYDDYGQIVFACIMAAPLCYLPFGLAFFLACILGAIHKIFQMAVVARYRSDD